MEKTNGENATTDHFRSPKGQVGWKSGSEKSGRKILLAGHPESRGRLMYEVLRAADHEVTQVHSAEEAIGPISSGSVDVLLLDNGLKDVTPVEFCRVLKRSHATQFLPTFVLSDKNDVETEAGAIEAGADAFLPLPIQPRILHAHINSSLHRKTLVDRLDDSESVLYSLAMSVEERDGTLGRHCERLASMAVSMGMLLGLPTNEIVLLQRAGYLHDIGKVAVPDVILFKAGSLTPEEWRVMERHTVRGVHICSRMKSLQGVLPIIRHHHERWDGTGYPDRLKGEEIPLLARIIQLADIYDALTTARSYKRALSPAEAIDVIREETAKGWRDPELTARFADLLPSLGEAVLPDLSQLSLQALAGKVKRDEFAASHSWTAALDPTRLYS